MTQWNIIVGMDLSAQGRSAFGMALGLARTMESAHIHLAHAITEREMASDGDILARRDEAMNHLPTEIWAMVSAEMEEQGVNPADVAASLHIRIGAPDEVVRQVAVDYDGTLVVVGSRNPKGIDRLVMGSVAQKLVRDGRFPVLVAHPNLLSTLEKTVMPDEPRPGEVEFRRSEGPHVYRSTLIDAWSALGRPTGRI